VPFRRPELRKIEEGAAHDECILESSCEVERLLEVTSRFARGEQNIAHDETEIA